MKNFIQNEWKSAGFFMFLFFHGMIAFAMNVPIVSNDVFLKPDKIMTIFDPRAELKFGRPWSETVPGSMMITPGNKGVVIGECGRVCYVQLDSEFDVRPEVIIEHHWVKHSPMIETAEKSDGSLLVVSAGNYMNEDKKRVAEYILFCNKALKFNKLDWPIQAISLDSRGTVLVIAGHREIMVIDLEAEKHHSAFFRDIKNNDNWIGDIVIAPDATKVLAVASHEGKIQWIDVSKDDKNSINVATLKQVECDDVVKKIYYPSRDELLYITSSGKAKIIDMRDLSANNGEVLKSVVFADSSSCNMGSADLSKHIATVHWNDNKNGKKDVQHKIKVYRKSNECIEKFVLEMSDLQKRYDYINELGQCGSGIGYLLHVVLRDKFVIALATDGRMRRWSLPEKNPVCNEIEKKDQELLDFSDVARKKQSNSESRQKLTSSHGDQGDKPKAVSSRIRLFKRASSHSSNSHGSKESSPIGSRESSPAPHRIDNKGEQGEKVTFAGVTEVKKHEDKT